jgi:hypothetical protein
MALTQQSALRLLKRWQGTGYTNDDDSVRVRELSAIAKIAAMASEAIDVVTRNLLIASADEALDVFERTRFLVAQSSLTPTRRRARLHAFARAAAKLVGPRLDSAFASYLSDATGTTISPSLAATKSHHASPLAALVVGRREPTAHEEQARRDLTPALQRGLPARAILGGVSSIDAEYGVAFAPEAMALVVSPPVTIESQTKARAAPIELYPGAVITREQWIEIQAMLLWKSHGFSLDQSSQGRIVFCDVSLAAGAVLAVDGLTVNDGIAWGGRVVQAWGTVSETSSDDLTVRSAAEHVWLSAMKLALGYTHELRSVDLSAAGVTLSVDADGNLTLSNENATERYCTLLFRATPPCIADSEDDSQPWVNADVIEHNELAELYASSLISDATPNEFAGAPAGALRRIVYTGGLTREPGTDRVRRVVLDSSEDWRNRYVLVAPLTFAGPNTGETVYPEAGSDGLLERTAGDGTPRMFFTGEGTPAEARVALPFQHPDSLSGANIWLYADLDGHLCAEMKPASANRTCCFMALLVATERSDGSSAVTPVPVHATIVQTIDLEQPQNMGCYAQGFQGGVPRYALDEPWPRTFPTGPPLGLIAEGHAPRRPVSWFVRERLGSVGDERYEVRQKIVGQRKRLISLALSPSIRTPVDDFDIASELMPGVNDQIDFRDRIVWIEGCFDTDDIRLGAAPQLSDEASTRFSALMYTGPDDDIEVPLSDDLAVIFTFSKSGDGKGYHSRLLLSNASDATTYYVNAAIECSGFTGLTDLRQYGVINMLRCASGDEFESDDSRGFTDDFKTSGGAAARAPGES